MTEHAEADRYARLFEAFEHARALGADERDAYLARLRDERPDVAAELQPLLDAEGDSRGDAFDTPAIDGRGPLVQFDPAAPDDELPASIGPFRVVRLLGRGGMGVVYEAEQDEPRRRVALKLVHAGLAYGERLRRFRREAEVLARLQHPGIAQIHATGTIDLGTGEQPYLVMELVQGESLLVHAERHDLSRTERVQLVARLCDAVQHAHDRGVVHRDLKPDNILVDERGQPKVLDFGIARLMDDDAGLATVQTQHGAIIGTLTHMAPEQLAGEPGRVGPRADVYALGVIAFELLAGRLPHNVAGLPATSVMRRLAENDAPRLGTVVRGLRGDLETIVGKALESDPARRYASAEDLGADLRRHLTHEPIAARAPSALYRAARFARRHRGLVAGTTAAMLALGAGVVVSTHFAIDAAAERRAAEAASYRHVLSAVAARLDRPASDAERALLLEAPEQLRGWEWEHLRARTADPSRVLCDGRPVALELGSVDGRPAVAVAGASPPFRIEVRALDDGAVLAGWDVDATVRGMAFSRDNELTWIDQATMTGTSPRPVRVGRKRLPDGEPRWLGALGSASPGDVALSADGHVAACLAVGDDRGVEVVLHDLEAGTSHSLPLAPKSRLSSLDAQGRWLCVEVAKSVQVIDTTTGAERLRLEQAGGCFDRTSGLLVVFGSADQQLTLWDVASDPPRVVSDSPHVVHERSVSVAPDRDALALVDLAGLLVRLDLDGSARETTLGRTLVPEWLVGIRWAPDGRQLVTTSSKGVRIWDGRARRDGVVARHASFAYAVDGHAESGRIATAGWDGWAGQPGCVRMHDTRTGDELWSFGNEDAIARTALFTHAPDLLAVGWDSDERSGLSGLDARTGAERWFRPGGGVEDLAVAPTAAGDPARVAAYFSSGKLGVFVAADGRELWSVQVESGNHGDWWHSVAWSPDGKRLAVTAGTTLLELRDARDGRRLAAWSASDRGGARLADLAFSPDGAVLASASEDHTVALWDARTGTDLHTRLVHDGPVLAVAWHPDGRRLVTGGRDGALHVWSVPDGRELLRLEGHTGYVKDLCWVDEGRTLLSASGDGTVRRWESARAEH